MADIVAERSIIQQEETAPQAAVSESTMTRVGANINFINLYQVLTKRMVIQGPYNVAPAPNLLMDGVFSYPFNFSIMEVLLSSGLFNGSSGTLELDIKWRAQNSGSWASIFSTTPKLTGGTVGQLTTIGLGGTVTGMVAPILAKTDFDAYDQIRFDILQVPSGVVDSATLETFWRPR